MTHRARSLRGRMTAAEARLWSVLRRDALGTRFRRQHLVCHRYVADFYAPARKLAIELDGGQHGESAAEARRTDIMTAEGISVLRFWSSEVFQDLDGVRQAICAVLQDLNQRQVAGVDPFPLTPLPAGGGDASVGRMALRLTYGRAA